MRSIFYCLLGLGICGCGPGMAIWEAAETGNVKQVQANLDNGVHRDAKYGGDPISDWDKIRNRTTRSANPIRGKNAGWTALDFAIDNNRVDVVSLLFEKGASIHHIGWEEIVKSKPTEFLKAGLKRDKTILDKHPTLLHTAAANGRGDMVELLLSAGVDVNSFDREQKTALDCAQLTQQDLIAKLLLRHGATHGRLSI